MRTTDFYPFVGIDPAPDTCWSLHTGPDGRIYAAACCEHIPGGVVHIVRYNDQTDQLDCLINVGEAVGESPDTGRATQCKIHYSFAASPGSSILYAATHLSAPGKGRKGYHFWGEWKSEFDFPCSYLLAYDTERDEVAWTSPFIPHEGCRCLALDEERGRMYAISFPRDHFWIFDLAKRTIRDMGRLGSVNSQAIFTDRRGRVFTSNDKGQFVRYDPDTDVLAELPVRVPHTQGTSGWHDVFYDVVASPEGDCVYGVPWNADPHLFRYWPEDGPDGRVEDLGPVHQRRDPMVMVNYAHDHCGGLVFGADGMLYYGITRWADGADALPGDHALEGWIVQLNPQTLEKRDFARIDRSDAQLHYCSRAGRDRHGHLYFGHSCAKLPLGVSRLPMDTNGRENEPLHLPLRTWG